MARPTKRTDAAQAVILEILRAGSTRKAAYTAAGLSRTTFAEWLNEDEDFAQEVEEAEQDAITDALKEILAQGKKDWRALAWWVERKDPEHFATKIEVNRMTDEELLAEARAISERAGDPGGDEAPGAEAPASSERAA